jgi:inosine/xanthosine triphosphatase
MANEQRQRNVVEFSERKRLLEEYLNSLSTDYPEATFQIIEIKEVFNKAITSEREADALVVSEGRKHVAKQTNEHRKKHGKAPLEIVIVPYVLAQDGLPIKATRIVQGEIDENGKLLGTVRISVGTENKIKLEAVKNVLSKVFSDLEILHSEVPSGVSEQPWDDDTITGARNRAEAVLEKFENSQFGIGIEAGLINNDKLDTYFDVQYCAIVDCGGRVTYGHGSGFYYPEKVFDGVKAGSTVGEVMSKVTGVPDIGSKQGAIGHLSEGLLTRESLTEQAVLMAMVPRLSELYD